MKNYLLPIFALLIDCRVRKSKQATYDVEKRLVKKEYVKQN